MHGDLAAALWSGGTKRRVFEERDSTENGQSRIDRILHRPDALLSWRPELDKRGLPRPMFRQGSWLGSSNLPLLGVRFRGAGKTRCLRGRARKEPIRQTAPNPQSRDQTRPHCLRSAHSAAECTPASGCRRYPCVNCRRHARRNPDRTARIDVGCSPPRVRSNAACSAGSFVVCSLSSSCSR